MNEPMPPSGDQETADAQAHTAAAAERREAPVPVGGPSTAPYGPYMPPRDPSVPLRGPYPPAPYQPYPSYQQPYAPYPPNPPVAPYGRGGRERQPISAGVVAIGILLIVLAILMAGFFIFAGVLQGMAWIAQPAKATETRTFTVAGTPTLALDVSAGNVHILPGTSGQITATLTKEVHAITHTAAQQTLDAITLDATQTGDSVRITVHDPGIDGFPTWVNRQMELTVSVPASANLDLTLSAGNLDAHGISGNLVARVSAGNLDLRDMTTSGNSSLHVTAGNVSYTGALAPGTSLRLVVTAGNVDIALPAKTPTHLEASATAGNLQVHGWPGVNTTRSGVGGLVSVDLNPQPTSNLSIDVTAGNVTVEPGA